MFYQIKSYIKFWIRSTNAHGVHSPFVYNLVTKCFYDQKKYPEYKLLKEHRLQLLRDKTAIEITDFGAGSRVFKSNERRISSIARNAGIPKRRQQRLCRLSKYFSGLQILELGTSLGLATSALALGNKMANVTSVEGCVNTANRAIQSFNSTDITNVNIIISTFESFFGSLDTEKYDLIYMDGNHSKERTLAYFDELLPRIHNDSVVILDDIYWSQEMTEAWNILRRQLKVTVSIDTFHWGILFFRREQPKQHFYIRL